VIFPGRVFFLAQAVAVGSAADDLFHTIPQFSLAHIGQKTAFQPSKKTTWKATFAASND
jgi:hypothetical protein